MEKVCENCGKSFSPLANVKNQSYCSKKACQKARKKKWHQQKLKTDPDYRRNQADAQAVWRRKHQDYWKEYRNNHPEYTARNRFLQQERNQRLRQRENSLIAKMDESNPGKNPENKPIKRIYLLTPLDNQGIAKMDAWKVEINEISSVSLDFTTRQT